LTGDDRYVFFLPSYVHVSNTKKKRLKVSAYRNAKKLTTVSSNLGIKGRRFFFSNSAILHVQVGIAPNDLKGFCVFLRVFVMTNNTTSLFSHVFFREIRHNNITKNADTHSKEMDVGATSSSDATTCQQS
jgi:hypothetical protein